LQAATRRGWHRSALYRLLHHGRSARSLSRSKHSLLPAHAICSTYACDARTQLALPIVCWVLPFFTVLLASREIQLRRVSRHPSCSLPSVCYFLVVVRVYSCFYWTGAYRSLCFNYDGMSTTPTSDRRSRVKYFLFGITAALYSLWAEFAFMHGWHTQSYRPSLKSCWRNLSRPFVAGSGMTFSLRF